MVKDNLLMCTNFQKNVLVSFFDVTLQYHTVVALQCPLGSQALLAKSTQIIWKNDYEYMHNINIVFEYLDGKTSQI